MEEVYKKILSIASEAYISEPKIVGGIPRDIYLDTNSGSDVDITTNDADCPRLGISLASSISTRFKMFEDGHVSVYTEGGGLDFSGNFISKDAIAFVEDKKGSINTYLHEVYSRDFTINTLHKKLLEQTLEDPTDLAINDLDKKIIRTIVPPSICFSDDIRRIFRAINFSSRFKFTIDGEIVDYARENTQLLSGEMGRSLRDAFVTSIISESIREDADRTLGYLSDMNMLSLIPLVGRYKEELIKRRLVAKYLDGSSDFGDKIQMLKQNTNI